MIKIGVVNIDVSHPKTFSAYLQQGERARYYAVYNDGFREDDEVDGFIKQAGLKKRCNTVEELASLTDIGFIQGCNWDRHLELAQAFFDIDKPVFIDKPIVGSMPDCIKLMQLADAGKVVLGSSSVRYAQEISQLKQTLHQQDAKIVNVYGTSGVDEFNYGVHIVEGIGGLLGLGARSCTYMGNGSVAPLRTENYMIEYESGIAAIYTTCQGTWMPFHMIVMTTHGSHALNIDTGKIYGTMLDQICTYMETGENTLASVPELVESVKIMIAGKISREQNGKKVYLNDVPSDEPGYDGYAFEKGYAAQSSKIYL